MQQKLSPQQIQLMKLLQIPVATLDQRIKEEIQENPGGALGKPLGTLKCRCMLGDESLPTDALPAPVGEDSHRQEVPELNRVAALQSARQEKNLLL